MDLQTTELIQILRTQKSKKPNILEYLEIYELRRKHPDMIFNV